MYRVYLLLGQTARVLRNKTKEKVNITVCPKMSVFLSLFESLHDMIYDITYICIYIYIYIYIYNRNWVDTQWQQYTTHLHTNSTHNTENGKLGSG
jgi:hypothetical protein